MKRKFIAPAMGALLLSVPVIASASYIPELADPGEFYGTVGGGVQSNWHPNFQIAPLELGGSLTGENFFDIEVDTTSGIPYVNFGYAFRNPVLGGRVRGDVFFSGIWGKDEDRFDRLDAPAGEQGRIFHIDGSNFQAFTTATDVVLDYLYESYAFGGNIISEWDIGDGWGAAAMVGLSAKLNYAFGDLKFSIPGTRQTLNEKFKNHAYGIMLGGHVSRRVAPKVMLFGGGYVQPMLYQSDLKVRQSLFGNDFLVEDNDSELSFGGGVSGGVSVDVMDNAIISFKGGWNWRDKTPIARHPTALGQKVGIGYESSSSAKFTVNFSYAF